MNEIEKIIDSDVELKKEMKPGGILPGALANYKKIEYNGKVVGVLGMIPIEGETPGRRGAFINVGILKEFRQKGLAKQELLKVIREARFDDLYSSIALDNKASIRLHEALGFERSSKEREEFLRRKGVKIEGRIRMTKHLKPLEKQKEAKMNFISRNDEVDAKAREWVANKVRNVGQKMVKGIDKVKSTPFMRKTIDTAKKILPETKAQKNERYANYKVKQYAMKQQKQQKQTTGAKIVEGIN